MSTQTNAIYISFDDASEPEFESETEGVTISNGITEPLFVPRDEWDYEEEDVDMGDVNEWDYYNATHPYYDYDPDQEGRDYYLEDTYLSSDDDDDEEDADAIAEEYLAGLGRLREAYHQSQHPEYKQECEYIDLDDEDVQAALDAYEEEEEEEDSDDDE